MEKNPFLIEGIPAILWGPSTGKLLIAVHGKQSNKEDAVIGIVAETAVENGYQVLSFDLPEHGEREQDPRLCDTENCAADLAKIMKFARGTADNISVFGCSVGANFALLAYQRESIKKAFFLSPVVDMKRLIRNIMLWFNVSEEQLESERQIETPVSTLYWHDYQYVLGHPVCWDKPTALLYGDEDKLVEYETIKTFADASRAKVTVLEGGEHFFHTKNSSLFFESGCVKIWLIDVCAKIGAASYRSADVLLSCSLIPKTPHVKCGVLILTRKLI